MDGLQALGVRAWFPRPGPARPGGAPLLGEGVSLDRPRPTDWRVLDLLAEAGAASGGRVAKPGRHVFKAWARQVARLPPESEGAWIIRDRGTGGAVGLILYAAATPRCGAALTVGVAAGRRRRGHAREAITLAMRHLFDDLGFSDVAAEIALRNIPSLKLFLGLGFSADLGEERRLASFSPEAALTLRLTAAAFAARAAPMTDGG